MDKDDVYNAAIEYYEAKKQYLLLETHRKENINLWAMRQARMQRAAQEFDRICKEHLNEQS